VKLHSESSVDDGTGIPMLEYVLARMAWYQREQVWMRSGHDRAVKDRR